MGFFDTQLGLPALSWKTARKGTTITGLIVPQDGKAYIEQQQTAQGSGKPLTWDDGRPRMQAVVMLLTDLTDWQGCSEEWVEKWEAEPEDDRISDVGLRRWFVAGASAPKETKQALRAIKKRDLEVGMTVTVRLLDRKPNDGGREGKTNVFSVTVEPATPESVQRANSHAQVTAAPASPGGWGGGDSSSAGGDVADDEPPF
jgi:hypothetical protein